MGTSKDRAALAAKLTVAATAIANANRNATAAAAQEYKESVLVTGRAATGGDLRLSRWGKKGVKLGAGYDVDGQQHAKATLTARPMGPWKVVEYGAASHPIVPGATKKMRQGAQLMSLMTGTEVSAEGVAGSRRGAKKRRVMAWGSGNIGAYVRHPGTKGKKAWSVGIAQGTPSAIRAYKKKQVEALGKVF